MRYEKARDKVFHYLLLEKELNDVNNIIRKYERNMPYDNDAASMFTMELMDIEIKDKERIEKEMSELKEEIDLILRIFK